MKAGINERFIEGRKVCVVKQRVPLLEKGHLLTHCVENTFNFFVCDIKNMNALQ